MQHDDEEWQRYRRAQAAMQARHTRQVTTAHLAEIDELIAATPGAAEHLAQLIAKTNGELEPQAQLKLVLETARRLNASHAAQLAARA